MGRLYHGPRAKTGQGQHADPQRLAPHLCGQRAERTLDAAVYKH